MSDDSQRIEELLTALVRHRIGESLADVEDSLASWRRGERDVLDAHGEILRHSARTHALTMRVARATADGPASLLRDALDAGLLDGDEFRRLTGKSPDEVERSPSPEPAMDKRTVLDKLLGAGAVLIHVDPRRAGVDVPPGHRDGPALVLRFGHELTPPILGLHMDETGVGGTLTFGGEPYRCFVPWPAVFALVGEDGRGLVWTDEVPSEVAQDYQKSPDQPDAPGSPAGPRPGSTRGRAHLKLV